MTATTPGVNAVSSPTPTKRRGWGHRPALDGLRVFAVYAVVLFHAKWSLFDGGFIGVDLFFVLSGFLVSNVLWVEYENHGRIRFLRFYARRFRRLLPAAAVMIVVTAIVWLATVPALSRADLTADARGALLYYANWHFLSETLDYFAQTGEESPFLHFWSLSIEEQFYFAFPAVLAWSTWLARRTDRPIVVPAVIGLITAMSFTWQLVMASENPTGAYFHSGTRIYQMLAGVLLAYTFRLHRERSQRDGDHPAGQLLAGVSLVAFVVLSTDLVDVSASARGVFATFVALGLVAGLELGRGSVLASALSVSPMQWLGQISYGTYLWHWPVYLMSTRMLAMGPISAAVISVIGGTAAAALSAELVERPIREAKDAGRFNPLVVLGGLAASVVLGLVVVPSVLEADRTPIVTPANRLLASPAPATLARQTPVPSELDLGNIRAQLDWESFSCFEAPASECVVRDGSGPHVHIVGDSIANALMPMWERIAEQQDLTLSATVKPGCGPYPEVSKVMDESGRIDDGCVATKADYYGRVIPNLDPDIVVVAHKTFDDPYSTRELMHATDGLQSDQTSFARERAIAMADEFLAQGRQVILIEPVPISQKTGDGHYDHFDSNLCLSAGASFVESCASESGTSHKPTETTYRWLDSIHNQVTTIDLDPLLCPRLPMCDPIVDDIVVWADPAHMSVDFAQHMARPVRRMLHERGLAGFDRDEAEQVQTTPSTDPPVFDLALAFILPDSNQARIEPLEEVDFRAIIYNQGTVNSGTYNVTVHLPVGFMLADEAWNASPDGTTATATSATPLPPGQSTSIDVRLRAASDAHAGPRQVWAEISRSQPDVDSTPDTDQSNDAQPASVDDPTNNERSNADGDEDDHDLAGVTVTDPG